MEYDELVEFYRRRLLDRYRECVGRSEWDTMIEQLRHTDEYTRRKIMELLNVKKEGA